MLISLNCLLGCKQLIDLVNSSSIFSNQFLFAYKRIIRCLKTIFFITKYISIRFDRDKKHGRSKCNNADVLLPEKCVVCIFQVCTSSKQACSFFSRHFSYLRVKYGFPHKQARKVQPKTRRELKPSNQPTKMLLCFGLIQFCVPKICARKEPLPKLSCSSYTLLHLSTCVRQRCSASYPQTLES